MSDDVFAMHYVCTPDEARKLINKHERFWVCNCGCREGRGFCTRSRIDVCLMFRNDIGASGSGLKEISYGQVEMILDEAKDKHLVSRPFRNMEDKTIVDGICFCCDDCCGYFLSPDEKCDKGALIENTFFDECTHCGVCVEVCYFDARKMVGGKLEVEADKCYGCGLCVDICPESCIRMVTRHGRPLIDTAAEI
jgi:Pyruvate/2-oxoacid:ferredoxin oxidoreductase delta subunit